MVSLCYFCTALELNTIDMVHTRFENIQILYYIVQPKLNTFLFVFFFYSYLRSIAYREFSRLVYGFLGNKRIPLPACAYTAIRKQFPVGKDGTYTGLELDEDD